MLFNSFSFYTFFPIVLAVYFIIPKKIRYIWLLITSYYFYMSWNPKYAILIGISTFITYLSGVLLRHANQIQKKSKAARLRKWIIAGSIVSNLGILFFFKYFDFFIHTLNLILGKLNIVLVENPFDFILPVGISFYTFQALSYTIDVYRGDIEAELNPLKYALFVSFFPQLVAGPIERSTCLLKQIQNVHEIKLWDFQRVTSGFSKMLWGYFLKIVISDRLAILVDNVFENYTSYNSSALIIAAVFFAFQIYCDFSSYSLIAIGAAKVMGFTLMENFNTPYYSASIKEFWHRWHISLSTWFRDYLYVPLGGSRVSRLRKYLNIMITFMASGLWHGPSFNFVIWGALHGVYQIIGDILQPVKLKLNETFHVKYQSFSYRLGQMFINFILVDIAWIFFRANSSRVAVDYIKRIICNRDPWSLFNASVYSLGLSKMELGIAIGSLLLLAIVDLIYYFTKQQLDEFLNTQCLFFRWGFYILLFCLIFVFGIYGPSYDATAFYYFQF